MKRGFMTEKHISAEKLKSLLWQNIRKDFCSDRIELSLPFYFSTDSENEPLRLIWKQDGSLSDGGRTLRELKKRLEDIQPYMSKIKELLSRYGAVVLEGEQNLVIRDFQTYKKGNETFLNYNRELVKLLQIITIISIIDAVTLEKRGEPV